MEPSGRLRVLTFRRLHVERSEGEVSELEPKRLLLAVLAYLAVEGEATRDRLLGLFWRDRDPTRARHSLSQALYELRQLLGDAWIEVGADRIRTTAGLECDAREFLALSEAGRASDALALYAGPFLDGFIHDAAGFEHWAAGKRALFARQARELHKVAVDEAVARGDGGAALGFARRWVEGDRLDDEGQHRLIEILAALGDRAEALRTYEAYRDLLAEEDLRPLEHTEALIDRIRAGELPDVGGTLQRDPAGPLPPSVSSEGPGASADSTRLRTGAPTPGPRLVRLVEGEAVEAYPVQGSRLVIGPRGDLPIPEAVGVNATLLVRTVRTAKGEETRYILRDDGSRAAFGVRVRAPWQLKEGDEFIVGRQRFRYEESAGAS